MIICDIDGTIADIKHRLHFLSSKPKNWDAFYEACDKDDCYQKIVALVRTLGDRGHPVIYVSGRRESTRNKTMAWLAARDLPFGALFMRADGDFRPDTVVKKEILDRHIDKNLIWFVLDDRDSVVKMWRDEGLTCLQVKEGDY